MEKLKKTYQKFLASLSALEVTIQYFNQTNTEKILTAIQSKILVASLIKHFEICYEMCWKFFQEYLKFHYKIELASPKGIFRECFTQQLINQSQTKELLDISEARNATTHDYNEETAKEICDRLLHYCAIFKQFNKFHC